MRARSFAFGPFVLIPERQLLLKDGAPVRVGGRALDILTNLVERPGELVSKNELLSRVWPETHVEEQNLKVNLVALRRALGDAPDASPYIATVVGRGYRFVAPVQPSASAGPSFDTSATALRRHNLPFGTTRIVGRAGPINAIRHELEASRLVSIVGPGGIGKTTVALAVAEQMTQAGPRDGIWLVDLAPLKDPSLASNAIATAIGLEAQSADMLTALCAFLRDREMLLVLDSCEHMIDAVAFCTDRILSDAAGVKCLVTSREALGVKGEHVRNLPGLDAPPPSSRLTAEEALQFPAIQLFVDRATERLESFTFSDAEAPMVAEICRRLDGLALAIELAATHVDVFGVRGLLEQFDDRLRLLTGRRAGPERHRTVTATLDWSYSLVSPIEASLLRALSVFAGAFTLDGASAVSNIPRADVVHPLAQLAAKSLLAVDIDTSAEGVTYRLLETTRAYCLERLGWSGEDQPVHRRHAEQVCAILERAGSEWAQRPAREWGASYVRVLDDLRAALAWAEGDAGDRSLLIRLTVGATLLWNHFSLTEECRIHVTRAVAELAAVGLIDTATEMRLQTSLGTATFFTRGPVSAAIDAMRRAHDIAARIGDTDYHLLTLRMIAGYEMMIGEHESVIRRMEAFFPIAAAKDASAVAEGEPMIALAELYVGRLHSALRRVEHRFRSDLRGLDDTRFARFQYDRNGAFGIVLAKAQWLMGFPDAAAHTAEAVVAQALETGHNLSLTNALAAAACPIALWSGHHGDAGRYLMMLEDHVERHGIETWRAFAFYFRAALACAQHDTSLDAVGMLTRATEELEATNHRVRFPHYLGTFADALAQCGRLVDAAATVEAALARADAQSERWCVPELLRIRASILTADDRLDEAVALLTESMALAKEIGALSWRLRAANDLARLWRSRSRDDDARGVLLPVYREFTEGFATGDLVVAADLLAGLQ